MRFTFESCHPDWAERGSGDALWAGLRCQAVSVDGHLSAGVDDHRRLRLRRLRCRLVVLGVHPHRPPPGAGGGARRRRVHAATHPRPLRLRAAPVLAEVHAVAVGGGTARCMLGWAAGPPRSDHLRAGAPSRYGVRRRPCSRGRVALDIVPDAGLLC